jgi:beta-lactamase superfamily II metal-dependent hydrolase
MPPPAEDELEITLLGRGHGESVVVHLLDGRWMIIDSFNRARKQPAAKWYLETIGVVSQQVDAVVLTHFHADHHRGIAELHDWCPTARVVTTGALSRHQFRWLRASKDGQFVLGKIAPVIESAKEHKRQREQGGHLRAQIGQLIVNSRGVTATALSPTADAMDVADQELGDAIQEGWEAVDTQLRDDNRCSVVVHLDLRGLAALFCADLLRHPEYGWAAVLSDDLCGDFGPAGIVKAGHHGGESGHDDEMWARLVEAQPVVLVAPYRSSGIPTDPDIDRLSGLASEVWEAAPADGHWTDEGGIRLSVKGETGFVRARRRLDEDRWRVEGVRPGRCRHP